VCGLTYLRELDGSNDPVKAGYTGLCRGNPMLTLHHLNDSRSQRILWLLEELGTPYEMKRYQRDARRGWRRRS
jgi:hypothetical protein